MRISSFFANQIWNINNNNNKNTNYYKQQQTVQTKNTANTANAAKTELLGKNTKYVKKNPNANINIPMQTKQMC